MSRSPGFTDDPSEEGQKPKKVSRSSDVKKTAIKPGKKLRRPHSLKMHQSHLNLLIQMRKSKKKKDRPMMIKGKKNFTGVERRNQKFFWSSEG